MSTYTRLALLLALAGSLSLPAHSQEHAARNAERSAAEAIVQPTHLVEQKLSHPAVITYSNRQLSVKAENTMLSDVLREISRETGVVFDVPPGGDEAVSVAVGPGTLREVLAFLLDGSDFNYVMLGSPDDPNTLTQVILSRKPAPMDSADIQPQAGPTMEKTAVSKAVAPYEQLSDIPQEGVPASATQDSVNVDNPPDSFSPSPQSSALHPLGSANEPQRNARTTMLRHRHRRR